MKSNHSKHDHEYHEEGVADCPLCVKEAKQSALAAGIPLSVIEGSAKLQSQQEQDKCEHFEYDDHGCCLDCGEEKDWGAEIDRAMDFCEGDR